jgi:hypothetical protein
LANQLVVSQNRAGCGRAFGWTWAKSLKNKGDFEILVNESLTPEPPRTIMSCCGFAATP